MLIRRKAGWLLARVERGARAREGAGALPRSKPEIKSKQCSPVRELNTQFCMTNSQSKDEINKHQKSKFWFV